MPNPGFYCRAVDPDPQSFTFPDPWGKIWKITQKKCKETGNKYNFNTIFKVNLDQLYGFFNFFLLQLQQAHHKVIFTKFLKLDPDPHWESSWILIRIEKTAGFVSPNSNADPHPLVLRNRKKKTMLLPYFSVGRSLADQKLLALSTKCLVSAPKYRYRT